MSYDYENRLVEYQGPLESSQGYGTVDYVYDYRTRRVGILPTGGDGALKIVFSGGLSVADYDAAGTQLVAEYVRGSDWGGGVGGLLYSLRDGVPSYKHYDARGDVVAETDAAGTQTWQANYQAFGTRTAELGTSLDPQRANTKDEDPTGLLNEGMRYRDLETGTFLTRDPMGFVDGPNLYAYVVQNPWTKFDPEGLFMGTSLSAREFFSSVGSGLAEGGYDVAMAFRSAAEAPGAALGYMSVNGVGKTIMEAHDQITTNLAEGYAMAKDTSVSQLGRDIESAADLYVNDHDFRQGVTEAVANMATGIATGEALQPIKAAVVTKIASNFRRGATSAVEAAEEANAAAKCTGPGCFVAGTLVAMEAGSELPIETVRVGQRVLTPSRGGSEPSDVDPASLRLVTLEKCDGDTGEVVFEVRALEPVDWLQQRRIGVGTALWYEVPEIGFADTMTVVEIDPCPKLEDGCGRLVTATYVGHNSDVWSIWTGSATEPIEATSGHPVYSETRGDWVPAAELCVGEEIETATGSTTVTAVEALPGRYTVYNFTVDVEHCYYVGGDQVLVHNAGDCNVGGQSAQAAENVGANSAAQAAKLRTQLAAEEIAGGHAYGKHVVKQGEFPGVTSPKQFAGEVERTMTNATDIRHLSNGRTAYWDNSTGTVVIRNPAAVDGGTAFKPTAGKSYFDGLK